MSRKRMAKCLALCALALAACVGIAAALVISKNRQRAAEAAAAASAAAASEAAKAAEVTEHLRTIGSFNAVLYQLNGFVACIDINTGISSL